MKMLVLQVQKRKLSNPCVNSSRRCSQESLKLLQPQWKRHGKFKFNMSLLLFVCNSTCTLGLTVCRLFIKAQSQTEVLIETQCIKVLFMSCKCISKAQCKVWFSTMSAKGQKGPHATQDAHTYAAATSCPD